MLWLGDMTSSACNFYLSVAPGLSSGTDLFVRCTLHGVGMFSSQDKTQKQQQKPHNSSAL